MVRVAIAVMTAAALIVGAALFAHRLAPDDPPERGPSAPAPAPAAPVAAPAPPSDVAGPALIPALIEVPAAVPVIPPIRPVRTAGKFLACDRYDAEMEAAVARWWLGGPDWLWLKAQMYQESRCNPTARSPVGALGIAQFMGPTWNDIMKRLGEDPAAIPRTHASMAIKAGAFYMRVLKDQWRGWSGSLDVMETHFHAMAGYNAGSGNIRKAWERCGRPAAWDATVECLASVTGRHAAETRGYIVNGRRWRAEMGG